MRIGNIQGVKVIYVPTQYVRRAVVEVHGKCAYCGGDSEHADHIVSSKAGGADDARNLIAACASCNCAKGARRLERSVEREMLARAWIAAPDVHRRSVELYYATFA